MDAQDAWLDEYESLWIGCRSAPDLLRFVQQPPAGVVPEQAVGELALIDLEQRWRAFYRPSVSQRTAPTAGLPERPEIGLPAWPGTGLPALPRWSDYCRLLPACSNLWAEGSCREFRARQLFGDRPDYRTFLEDYPEMADALKQQLPDIAAELTRAHVTCYSGGRANFSCPLPGRLHVGRRRLREPSAPALIDTPDGKRLLVADAGATHISRELLSIECLAVDRVTIRYLPTRGYMDCVPGARLGPSDVCEAALPVQLNQPQLLLRIERAGR